jgi:hypothetical protein
MAATAQGAKRPQVRGTVILSFLGGALNIWGGLTLISAISLSEGLGTSVETWIKFIAYLSLVIGVLEIAVGILLILYKRIGLVLGIVAYAVNLLITVLLVITGNQSVGLSLIVNVVVNFAILYYLYIYLTREPEKSYFT